MNQQLFFMAVIGSLKKYADDEISNGSALSATNSFVVSTPLQGIKSFLNPTQILGYQSIFLLVDRVNKTTYPFIAVDSSIDGVRAIMQNTMNSLFSNSSNVMNTNNNVIRIITPNILVNNMDNVTLLLTNNKTRIESFGDNQDIPSMISDILTESYREIYNIITANNLNPANIYQVSLSNPNTGTILMNGQFALSSGLIGVINNVYINQSGVMDYSIYFNFSYNLQRTAKNDLLRY